MPYYDRSRLGNALLLKALANTTMTGSHNMGVTASGAAPIDFVFRCQTTTGCEIHSLQFHIFDNGIDPADFGGIVGGLTNGLAIDILDENDVTITSMTNSLPIKTNSNLTLLVGNRISYNNGATDDGITASFNFEEQCGMSLKMNNNHTINCRVRDDLSGITEMHIMVQGHYDPGN